MPSKISSVFRQVANDGRIGKTDVENIIKSALDGQGVTKAEAAKLEQLRSQFADKFTRKGAEAFDNFFSTMKRSWSRTKQVHLPNVDPQKVKALLESDPRIRIMTGRSVGGGESGAGASIGGASVGGGESPAVPHHTEVHNSVGGGESGGGTHHTVVPHNVGGGE